MSWIVVTTKHPDGKALVLEHGPFCSYIAADEYAARLRGDGRWGEVTVRERIPVEVSMDFPRPLGAPPLEKRRKRL